MSFWATAVPTLAKTAGDMAKGQQGGAPMVLQSRALSDPITNISLPISFGDFNAGPLAGSGTTGSTVMMIGLFALGGAALWLLTKSK
jgi:hypothetical protein